MINLVVYLNKEHDPVALVKDLLSQKLIANGSIDEQNNSYTLQDEQLFKQINFVITMQTRSLLFSEIALLIAEKYGPETPIYASPIVASNDYFDAMVRSTTKQIKTEEES